MRRTSRNEIYCSPHLGHEVALDEMCLPQTHFLMAHTSQCAGGCEVSARRRRTQILPKHYPSPSYLKTTPNLARTAANTGQRYNGVAATSNARHRRVSEAGVSLCEVASQSSTRRRRTQAQNTMAWPRDQVLTTARRRRCGWFGETKSLAGLDPAAAKHGADFTEGVLCWQCQNRALVRSSSARIPSRDALS